MTGGAGRSRRLLWRLVPTYLAVVAAFTLVVLGIVALSLKDTLQDRARHDLLARTRLAAAEVSRLEGSVSLQLIADELAEASGTRVTVIRADGRVLADSDSDPHAMENHGDRPEVRAALAEGSGWGVRYSETLGRDLAYAAVTAPVRAGGRVVVRCALAATEVHDLVAAVSRRLAVAAGAVAVLSVGLSWWVSWRLALRLEGMRRAAESFARGDLGAAVPTDGPEELAELARALNRTAVRMAATIREISRRGAEQEAVLSSMSEGVLALDAGGTILSLNGAARRLLGEGAEHAEGRLLQEVSRVPEFDRVVSRVLDTAGPVEDVVDLRDGTGRTLEVRGSVLRDGEQAAGVVLVLADISRLRRLEGMRREFVANVSHELRTPITAIRGFLETLEEEGLDDGERTRHFLAIVRRQSERLSAIVEDLLALSRLEHESEGRLVLRPGRVRPVLEAAAEACRRAAEAAGVSVEVDGDAELRAPLEAALLEQAVVNLLDNAIKASEEGGCVRMEARQEGTEMVIRVSDEGCGIPAEHLPRLFERFYRVDKARSRKEGGTGLGLAIVKHVALAHGGSATAESRAGEGSTFSLRWPAA